MLVPCRVPVPWVAEPPGLRWPLLFPQPSKRARDALSRRAGDVQSRNGLCFQRLGCRGLHHARGFGRVTFACIATWGAQLCAKPEYLLFSCRKTARVMSRTRIRRAGIDQNGGREPQMGQSRNVFCYQAPRCRGLRHAPGFGGARTAALAEMARGSYTGHAIAGARPPVPDRCVPAPGGYGTANDMLNQQTILRCARVRVRATMY